MPAFPPIGHPVNEAFDRDDLARIARGQYVPCSLREAHALARDSFERFKGAALKPMALIYMVLRADDNVDLISIGPRGGRKVLWRFGPIGELKNGKEAENVR